jgi:hypothetical protein
MNSRTCLAQLKQWSHQSEKIAKFMKSAPSIRAGAGVKLATIAVKLF